LVLRNQGLVGGIPRALLLEVVETIPVLARVDLLPVKELKELVEARGKQGSEDRPSPVDPVVVREVAVDYSWSERTSRVE
jgi:hypothetical protein